MGCGVRRHEAMEAPYSAGADVAVRRTADLVRGRCAVASMTAAEREQWFNWVRSHGKQSAQAFEEAQARAAEFRARIFAPRVRRIHASPASTFYTPEGGD